MPVNPIQRFVKNRRLLLGLLLRDRMGLRVLRRVQRERLTYLSTAALVDLHDAIERIEANAIPGVLVEAGSALGGSALVMATAKQASRPLRLYDAFGMIPPPNEKDGSTAQQRFAKIASGQAAGIGGARYYGYDNNLLNTVTETLKRFGHASALASGHIRLIKGLYDESLHINEPVALAHIDCDWYESVTVCLERIVPHLAVGGVLVIDDYFEWPGCQRAIEDFFAGRSNFVFEWRSRLHVVRQR